MKRRAILTAFTGTAETLTAGWGKIGTEDEHGVVITHVELGNGTGDPQVFDVLLLYNDEIMYWESHEVGVGEAEQEMGGEVIDIDAPDEPGRVEVAVRVDGIRKSRVIDNDLIDGDRAIVLARYAMIDDELRLSILETDRPANGDEYPLRSQENGPRGI